MPGKRGIKLSNDDRTRIREYIDANNLQKLGREQLAIKIQTDLGIEISGKSAAAIRREAFEDLDTANSQKEAAIREKVLEHVEVQAPKILQYIEDEIKSLRERAYGREGETPEEKEKRLNMGISERVKLSTGILSGCKALINIVGAPKPDRHIQTTIQVVPTCDVSEYMAHGDKYESGDESRTGSSPASD